MQGQRSIIDIPRGESLGLLLRLLLFALAAGWLLLLLREQLAAIYLRDQLTITGFAINGSILLLFLLGMMRMVTLLFHYMGEERAVTRFITATEAGDPHPAAEINPRTLIFQRYQSVVVLSREHVPINQSILASLLLAQESRRAGLPRFINNILILTGVLGTIISLSIALLGASNLLAAEGGANSEMVLVIHGMSTALATTITAIVCYLLHGYFQFKLQALQSRLISAIEQVTTLYLIPRYARTEETLLSRVATLVKALQSSAMELRSAQSGTHEAALELNRTIAQVSEQLQPLAQESAEIKQLLREGFRLHEQR